MKSLSEYFVSEPSFGRKTSQMGSKNAKSESYIAELNGNYNVCTHC
jgi:hypothetical protein